MTYRERLAPPWWWWPIALGLATLAAAEIHPVLTGGWRRVPYAVLLPLTALWLVRASRGRLAVEGGVLHVPGARIPVALLGPAVVLDRDALRRQIGAMADPRAFVVTRPWLHAAVRVAVEDPADPTPYWLIGTRHPEQLQAVLDG